jgi:hypothetical protein
MGTSLRLSWTTYMAEHGETDLAARQGLMVFILPRSYMTVASLQLDPMSASTAVALTFVYLFIQPR